MHVETRAVTAWRSEVGQGKGMHAVCRGFRPIYEEWTKRQIDWHGQRTLPALSPTAWAAQASQARWLLQAVNCSRRVAIESVTAASPALSPAWDTFGYPPAFARGSLLPVRPTDTQLR
jgi:hypothetical protein